MDHSTERPSNTSPYDWAGTRGEQWRDELPAMEAQLAPVDEPLIQALALTGPCRIADVGCGGGGTSLALINQAPAGSSVSGFDISSTLVEVARGRAQATPHHDRGSLTFQVANIDTAPVPTPPFERLLSRFGVMFYQTPERAFAQLSRWLTPDGRFAFAVWGPHADNTWLATARQVVAELVDLPTPGPDEPGPFRYCDADAFLALLGRCGFQNLAVQDCRFMLALGGGLSPLDGATFALKTFGGGNLLGDADPTTRERAHQALTERFQDYAQQDGLIRFPARVHLVTGQPA